MANPYQILGVSKTAGADEIKSAYRKLAKKLHPDVNPGRKDVEQKFKEVTAAYDLLSDSAKRARYDRGELDDSGNERGFSRSGGADPFAGMGRGSYKRSGGADPFGGLGADEFFAEFFGGAGSARRGGTAGGGHGAARGDDVTYELSVPFAEACLGGKRRVTLNTRKTVDVNIPAGTETGHKLRLRGLGGAAGMGEAGDAIVVIHVEPHPWFTRKDNDLNIEVPISLPEAIMGASIKVPTLDGQVEIKVPKGANSGSMLRLKGKGVPTASHGHGDMFVKLKIVLPDPVPDDLAEYMGKWAKKNAYDPRKKLGW